MKTVIKRKSHAFTYTLLPVTEITGTGTAGYWKHICLAEDRGA